MYCRYDFKQLGWLHCILPMDPISNKNFNTIIHLSLVLCSGVCKKYNTPLPAYIVRIPCDERELEVEHQNGTTVSQLVEHTMRLTFYLTAASPAVYPGLFILGILCSGHVRLTVKSGSAIYWD